ncbi:MAG: EutP/PduV family microcompartment system protein [Eubacterium sp.]|nr:EutP/PduV family microcompartment system protein [Eubacterium sp.]
MKKIVLMGRSEAGKTTLTQALKGKKIQYHKTQYVNNYDVIIDTPGEYAQTKWLGHALAMFSYEADVVGLLLSAIEPYTLFPPCCTATCNRDTIGIVTKINHPMANVKRAAGWLKLAGCRHIFYVDSKTGQGIPDILEYLKEPGDILPWEQTKNQQQCIQKPHKTT